LIARSQSPDLDGCAVYAGAVSAFEIGDDNIAILVLHFGVVTADSLVVQSQSIAFFATNGNGYRQVAEHATFIDAF